MVGAVFELAGRGVPLTKQGLISAKVMLGLPGLGGELWALITTETAGMGFLPDRRPKILFERHLFSALTNQAYDQTHPAISAKEAGGYGPPGAFQYERLAQAMKLDANAALSATSWGLGQLLGRNFKICGYESPLHMTIAMVQSEDNQLIAMARMIVANKWAAALKQHEWAKFARLYNGPNYQINRYDQRLSEYFASYTAEPDLTVRSVQCYLTYLGYKPGRIDGISGPATARAVADFQARNSLDPDGKITEPLLSLLATAQPTARHMAPAAAS